MTLAPDDARLEEIGKRDSERLAGSDKPVVTIWNIRRQYSKKELEQTELFQFLITGEVMASGEKYGTVYDRSAVCPVCGAGEHQSSDLVLDVRKAPKSAGIARASRDELVVSQQVAELLIDNRMTGFELQRVHHKVRHDEESIDLRRYPSGRELLGRAQEEGHPHSTGPFWVWLNRPEQAELVARTREEHIADATRRDIRHPRPQPPPWYQLIVTSQHVNIAPNQVRDQSSEQ